MRRPHLIVTLMLLIMACGTLAAGQQTARRAKGAAGLKRNKVTAPAKRFEVDKPITLTLAGCKGEINIPALDFSADGLEIAGDTVRLTSGAQPALQGSVVAYSRSVYYVDANVALTFQRMDIPFSDPRWKAPTTISFRLLQNRKKLKQLSLVPVPGAPSISSAAVISCAQVGAASSH